MNSRSGGPSSTNVVLIVCAVVGVLILGGGMVVVVCLAAITTIGSRADMTFQTVGASLSTASSGSSSATAPAEIRQVLDSQANAWNREDLDGFMAGYWNSPDLTFYSGKDKRQGWQETCDRYKAKYQGKGKEMGTLTFSELDIEMLGSDRAVVRGRWKVVMSKETPEGLFTLIVKKLPEGWRIIHDHTSAAAP